MIRQQNYTALLQYIITEKFQ